MTCPECTHRPPTDRWSGLQPPCGPTQDKVSADDRWCICRGDGRGYSMCVETLITATRQVTIILSLLTLCHPLAPHCSPHSSESPLVFCKLATLVAAQTRYISSILKNGGTLMRHGRRFCSSFIILFPPISTPFYQALAWPRVISTDINQLSSQAGALIMPY